MSILSINVASNITFFVRYVYTIYDRYKIYGYFYFFCHILLKLIKGGIVVYNTSNLQKTKPENTITFKKEVKCLTGFNAFQGGYGPHGKGKKAQNKASRKENRKLCASYCKNGTNE